MILFINLTFFTPDVSEILLVKPVYKGQSRGIPKVASVDRWPLFEASETTYQSFTGQIKTGLCGIETTIRRWLLCTGLTVGGVR